MPINVSVLVLTYNPDFGKLCMTLRSILYQRKIELQIVIADDGSQIDYFDDIKSFFEKYNYENYKLTKSLRNMGIVSNVANGLKLCDGEYIKLISPGDYLNGCNILHDWADYMRRKDLAVSAADAIYYSFDANGLANSIISKSFPQIKNLCGKKLKYNYLLNNDIFLGATTLCKKDIMNRYINLIEGKVVYAEDSIYRIMIYNDEKVGFFDANTIIYEKGTGVSTCNESRWQNLLNHDWAATNEIILEQPTADLKFRKKMKLVNEIFLSKKTGGRRYIEYFKIRGLVLRKLRIRLFPRFATSDLPTEWIEKLRGDNG